MIMIPKYMLNTKYSKQNLILNEPSSQTYKIYFVYIEISTIYMLYTYIHIYIYTYIHIYIYTYIHIYIYTYIHTSQSVIWNSILLALPQLSFFTAMPMSITFHLQSSGLLWVVTLWHVHSLRPVSPLVSCLVIQAGTCSAGITQPLT